MDSWTAVELVPYLFAVRLKSRCEEFSELERMSRETYNRTSNLGV